MYIADTYKRLRRLQDQDIEFKLKKTTLSPAQEASQLDGRRERGLARARAFANPRPRFILLLSSPKYQVISPVLCYEVRSRISSL
jgi:hypothetical protein